MYYYRFSPKTGECDIFELVETNEYSIAVRDQRGNYFFFDKACINLNIWECPKQAMDQGFEELVTRAEEANCFRGLFRIHQRMQHNLACIEFFHQGKPLDMEKLCG